MKTLNEMRTLVENNEANYLTIDYAKSHIGQAISTIYFGYGHQDGVDNLIIGDVKSEYEIAELNTDGNWGEYANQARYWDAHLNDRMLNEMKETYCLIAADGRNTYIRFHKENDGIASCSDIDRFVYFVEDK